jgi:fermentation-respiration switch protein FrsA (DUF1100 family)
MYEIMQILRQIYSAALSRVSLRGSKAEITQCQRQIRSQAADALGSENVYVESDLHPAFYWAHHLTFDRTAIAGYILSLLPAVDWLRRYNTAWLLADLIGGVSCATMPMLIHHRTNVDMLQA